MSLHEQNKNNSTTRRTVVKGAAWSVPVIAAAIATPAMAASTTDPVYGIESNFGGGWYANTPGDASAGVLAYDGKPTGVDPKWLRVTGTQAGDVVSNISIKVLISAGWPAGQFSRVTTGNMDWSRLAPTGGQETVDGVIYDVYISNYTGTVVASGSVTNIPVNFFQRRDTPFYAGQTFQTTRYVTVTRGPVSTPVMMAREVNNLVDTDKPVSELPVP